MSEKRYYQEEIETMPVEELRALQKEKLLKQVRHVYDNVPYYRAKMEELGVTPEDIKELEDLSKLPFLSKTDLRDAYPYGLLGMPLSECVRIHSTSGTTGKRVVAFYTQKDVDLWEDCCARAIVAVGGSKEDVCQVCYGYGLFTGGSGLHGGSHKVGCLTLPMSSGNTERQIQFMMDLNATILCCTPSYAAYLGESLKEAGYKPEDNRLKAGIFGAEPWTEEMRRDIEAFPLLRYRTKDICVLSRKKCSCGRTHIKMSKPMGRSDDMMIIRGVNVFPSQIEAVLLKEGYPPNYYIEVDRVNNSDTLDVFVELTAEQFEDTVGKFSARENARAEAIKTMVGVKPKVHLVNPKSIARSEGKAVRIVDKRKLH